MGGAKKGKGGYDQGKQKKITGKIGKFYSKKKKNQKKLWRKR